MKKQGRHTNTFTKFVALVIVFFFVFYTADLFFDNFDARSPIIWQSPVIRRGANRLSIEPLTPTPTPHQSPKKGPILSPTSRPRSEKEIIMATKHGEVLWKIYGLETTWGKNDYCRPNGYGGFGVMDNGKVVCYESFEKAVERADYWLTKNGVDKDLATTLCIWNEGVARNDCPYYNNYLTL